MMLILTSLMMHEHPAKHLVMRSFVWWRLISRSCVMEIICLSSQQLDVCFFFFLLKRPTHVTPRHTPLSTSFPLARDNIKSPEVLLEMSGPANRSLSIAKLVVEKTALGILESSTLASRPTQRSSALMIWLSTLDMHLCFRTSTLETLSCHFMAQMDFNQPGWSCSSRLIWQR